MSNDGYRGSFMSAQVSLKLPSLQKVNLRLEDLKVLRRSPDLFNYVEIGQGHLQLIIKHILFYHICGLQPFWSSDLKQSNEYSIKQPSDRYVAVQMSGTG